MSSGGLSKEDTQELLTKLEKLRVSIANDENKIKEQTLQLKEKDDAINKIYSELQNIRKELLVSGGSLTSGEFRSSVAGYLREIRNEVDYYRQNRSAKYLIKTPLKICLTGAAGQIGYSLIPLLCNGEIFGLDQPIELNLLEIENMLGNLNGVEMEIQDGSYELVSKITSTSDSSIAFKDVDYAILVGGFPRKKGMLRKDLLAKNKPIFEKMGQALQNYSKESTKVLVVANPANTNCLICSHNAPKIPKENFSALTRLDENRARFQLAKKLNTNVSNIKNVIIWGNHSSTQVPDITYSTISKDGNETAVVIDDEKWIDNEFRSIVQQRGKSIIEARNVSSSMSAANAVKDCLRDWHFGTPSGKYSSMAVYSDGSYDITKGIFFSFPVICNDGRYSIVKNLRINSNIKNLIKLSEKELLQERDEANKN